MSSLSDKNQTDVIVCLETVLAVYVCLGIVLVVSEYC